MTAPRAVVIGASAGAVQALSELLPALPADYRLPVLVVVHVPADRSNFLAPLFQHKCRIAVREAEDKEPIAPATVYFAPADYHLMVEDDATLSLSNDLPVHYSRPSIDVLFESAADAYGPEVIGIILTGANADGAQGLRAIIDAGGVGIVEAPDGAYADAMPRAAINLCPSASVLPLEAIASHLVKAGES
ncbi:chemotaxis protein CheB [Sphingomonas sp. HF-S3]|uniref:protein-glutamate methylesterase n=1 Tax=Sphingomonas rustica TaxID=3103142 RepID=A0ABV0BB52_9SPHN